MIDQFDRDALRESLELFYFAYRAFTGRADRILAEQSLGRVHHRVLYFVGRNPGLSVNSLVDTLGISKQALNAPLRQLTALDLIAVRTAENDRRCKELRLTPAGNELETRLTGEQMSLMRSVFADAGSEAGRGWQTVMRQLARGG